MAFKDLFGKKKEDELSDEELLSEIERETATLEKPPAPNPLTMPAPNPLTMPAPKPMAMPTPPPAPKPMAFQSPKPMLRPTSAIPRAPLPIQLPSFPEEKPEGKPVLGKEQVAKLPLFMKVEQYDKIVQELTTLVTSLKSMEDILGKMTQLEHEENETTERWREQLNRTEEQVRLLLSSMPETGKLREVMGVKKAAKAKAKMSAPRPAEKEKVSKDVEEMRAGLGSLQDEMKHLHLELKMLNSLTQLHSSEMVKDIKQTAKTAADIPLPSTKPLFQKSQMKSPWEKK